MVKGLYAYFGGVWSCFLKWNRSMITHEAIWAAIDGMAEKYKLTPSGLARAAGLDATAFNKSKRFTAAGRERWPSTESIAKVLDATGASFDEFVQLLVASNADGTFGRTIPLIDMDLAAQDGVFKTGGLPVEEHFEGHFEGVWDEINFPELAEEQVFALEVVVDDYEPVYWAGDVLVVSPKAEMRRGDRVALKHQGEILLRHFVRQSLKRVEVTPLDDFETIEVLDLQVIEWISRIVLVRQ